MPIFAFLEIFDKIRKEIILFFIINIFSKFFIKYIVIIINAIIILYCKIFRKNIRMKYY